jgi:hypothetical protein
MQLPEINGVTTDDTEDDLEPESLDIVYREAKDRLEVQLHQIDSLDSKAGTILFVASIMLGVAAAAQAAIVGKLIDMWVISLFSIPLILYLATVFFALRGWVVRPYFRDPEPRPLRDHYLFERAVFTKRRLITHFISSYEWNQGSIKQKVFSIRVATFLLLAQVLASAVILVVRPWLG